MCWFLDPDRVIQYNLSSLAIVIAIMTSHQDIVVSRANGLQSDYPEPSWAKTTLLGTVFAGAVCGMLSMGYVADVVGRRKAMLITQGFSAAGALASAVITFGSAQTVYALLTLSR